MSRAALPLLLLLVLVGCERRDDWAERIRPALEASGARAAAVNLPPGPAGLPTPSFTRAARLFLSGRTAVLDLAPLAERAFEPEVPESVRNTYLPGPPLEFAAIDADGLELPGTLDPEGHRTSARLGSVLEGAPIRRRDMHEVAVFAERGLSAGVLAQALDILAELGTAHAELRFLGPSGPVGAALSVGRFDRDPDDTRDEDLDLEVARVEGGLVVSGSGGYLRPGCREVVVGPVVTIADRPDGIELEGLTSCIRVIREDLPFTTMFLAADRSSVDDLAGLLHAIRAAADSVDVLLLERARPRPAPPNGLEDVLSGGAVTPEVNSVFAVGS